MKDDEMYEIYDRYERHDAIYNELELCFRGLACFLETLQGNSGVLEGQRVALLDHKAAVFAITNIDKQLHRLYMSGMSPFPRPRHRRD